MYACPPSHGQLTVFLNCSDVKQNCSYGNAASSASQYEVFTMSGHQARKQGSKEELLTSQSKHRSSLTTCRAETAWHKCSIRQSYGTAALMHLLQKQRQSLWMLLLEPDSTICPAGRTQQSMHSAGTAQHSTAQHSSAQHSTAQHSTARHGTAQHSTAQHSTSSVSMRCEPSST